MTQAPEKSAPKYVRPNPYEDHAWCQLYLNATQFSVAAEVVKHLDSHADLKRAHLGLYLRCKETLRRHAALQARNERIAGFVRLTLDVLIMGPIRALREITAVLIETLPQLQREPGVTRLRQMKDDPHFAQATAEVLEVGMPSEAAPATKSRSRQAA